MTNGFVFLFPVITMLRIFRKVVLSCADDKKKEKSRQQKSVIIFEYMFFFIFVDYIYYRTAIQDISILAFFGNTLTSTVSRAGGFDLKYLP